MRKNYLFFILAVVCIFSCKKEEKDESYSTNPHGAGNVVTHCAYIRGTVIDSVSGTPLPNAEVYYSDKPFSAGYGFSPSNDTTDVNGVYTRKITWYVGYNWGHYYSRPDDSTNLFVSAYSTNRCNFLKFKWGQLIENDTLVLPAVSAKPYAYVCTHVKEALPVSEAGIYLNWYYAVGPASVLFPENSDAVVTRQICPNLKMYISFAIDDTVHTDSVIVNSGDTTFVNEFY